MALWRTKWRDLLGFGGLFSVVFTIMYYVRGRIDSVAEAVIFGFGAGTVFLIVLTIGLALFIAPPKR